MTRSILALATLLAGVGITSTTASASQGEDLQAPNNQGLHVPAAGIRASTLSLPDGASLREITRLYNGRAERHATLHFFPDNWDQFGWRAEGSLGFISGTPFSNSKPLYACALWGHTEAYFTSPDPNCEGQFLTTFGMIGYISDVPLPDTKPIYRCKYVFDRKLRHFDTFYPNCENVPTGSLDFLIGYVFL